MSTRTSLDAKIHAFDPIHIRPKPSIWRFATVIHAVSYILSIFKRSTGKAENPSVVPEKYDSVFGQLPLDKQVHLLTFLEPHDLAKLGLTNKYWNNLVADDDVWRALAERIHCTVNGDSPVCHQVTAFIEELKEKVREVWAPENIVAILNVGTPTIDQINYLQNWRKARDTLVVWNELVEACRQQVPNALHLGGPGWEAGFADRFPTGQLMIDRANRFSNWFVANEPTLDQLTNLDFSHSKLRSIPMDIFHLSRLLELDISNCHLKELPEAMSNLTQLTKLDISFNKLSSLPDWLVNFRQLDSLYAGFNQLTSLPKWIGNLSLMVTLSLINNRIRRFTK